MRSKLHRLRWLAFALLAAGTLNASVCIGPNGFWFSTGGEFDDDFWDDDDGWFDDDDDFEDWWDDFWDD